MDGDLLEKAIIKKFHLFKGFRSKEEDEEILNKVYLLCLQEALIFIEDLIPPLRKEEILQRIDYYSTEEGLMDLFNEFIKDDLTRWRLKNRLLKFLDDLLINTIRRLD